MEITESSNLKSNLFCPVRGEWVEPLPEERVRQGLIRLMTEQLGYPLSLLVVEKALHQFPHLSHTDKKILPKRRADLVCYAAGIHQKNSLHPLLLVECKAIPLRQSAIQQLTGYNHYLQADFVALCNQTEIRTGYFDAEQGGYVFAPTLPRYTELLTVLEKRRLRSLPQES